MSRHLDSYSGLLLSHISHAINSDVSKNLDSFYQMLKFLLASGLQPGSERNDLHLFVTQLSKRQQ